MTPKKLRRKLRRFQIKLLWPLIPALLLIGLVILLSQLKVFSLRKITCRLDGHPCSLELEPILVNLYGQNLFKLDKKTLVNQLTQFDSTLTDIKITKNLPNQLSLDLKKRIPIAQIILVTKLDFQSLDSTASASLSAELTDQFFSLDKSGQVYQKQSHLITALPQILVPSSTQLDLGLTPASNTLANIVNVLKQHYLNWQTIAWLNFDKVIIKTEQGIYAVINPEKPINSTVASLQYVLSNIKIDSKLPSKIELRFDKPILTY